VISYAILRMEAMGIQDMIRMDNDQKGKRLLAYLPMDLHSDHNKPSQETSLSDSIPIYPLPRVSFPGQHGKVWDGGDPTDPLIPSS
jgi:hypothetical protein